MLTRGISEKAPTAHYGQHAMTFHRISPQLASLYRLFLRGTSVAVLNSNSAKKDIRILYRPIFEEAAQTEVRLSQESNPRARLHLEKWLRAWNKRGMFFVHMLSL